MAAILLGGLARLWAQTALSLPDAVRLGLERHPAVEASVASKKASESRVEQARAGYLPTVKYTESYERSNNPVFVFESLLTQRQFTAQNFELGSLNSPNFLNNFQSILTADQTVYDLGSTKAQVRTAELGTQMASEDERRVRMGVIAGVAGAYFGAILAQERLAVAAESVRAAESDLKQAETVRAAGMSTDADVLSVRVHLADMKQRETRARYAVGVANAALNDALGLPLETPHELSTPLAEVKMPEQAATDLDKRALEERPDARQASLAIHVAEAQNSAARSALFPRISVHGAFEADRQTFATRGGANWLFSASLTWNLFNGFATQARRQETEHLAVAARAEERRTKSQVRLEIRRAQADWNSAQERIGVASAAVAMAEESRRITRNRYAAGLTTITELLRNETAWLETRTRQLEAIYDQRLAVTAVELAAGTLTGDSDALK